LYQIDWDINKLEAKRERIRKIDRDKPFLDLNGTMVNIGDTIEIKNGYTNFSTNLPKSKRIRRVLERGSLVAGYYTDQFGEVTRLERTRHRRKNIDKVHFIIDSGFET